MQHFTLSYHEPGVISLLKEKQAGLIRIATHFNGDDGYARLHSFCDVQ